MKTTCGFLNSRPRIYGLSAKSLDINLSFSVSKIFQKKFWNPKKNRSYFFGNQKTQNRKIKSFLIDRKHDNKQKCFLYSGKRYLSNSWSRSDFYFSFHKFNLAKSLAHLRWISQRNFVMKNLFWRGKNFKNSESKNLVLH